MNRQQLVPHEQLVKSLIKINNLQGFLTLDLPANLTAIKNEIRKLLNPDRLCITLLDEDKAKDGFADCPYQLKKECCRPMRFSGAHECDAVRVALPVIVKDAGKEKGCRNCCLLPGFRSYACLPIVDGKNVLGILSLSSYYMDFSDHEVLEVLLVMANLIGGALQRNSLVRRIEAEKQELRQANAEMKLMAESLANTIEKLRTAQNQLIQNEKLTMAGRLTADLAHEINNPASIISSRAECMLMEEDQLSAEQKKDLEVIIKHAEKIGKSVRSMLSFARPIVEDKRPVLLEEVFDEALSFVAKYLQKHNIILEYAMTVNPWVLADIGQLQQVFLNLINNASDAMPGGGKLTIRVSYLNADYARIDIQDTGIGIPATIIDRIFEPFFTTKERGQGTGLGLSISHSIIQQHGGQVQVRSKEGVGAVFTVLLPVYTPKEVEHVC